jgi:hypothetical protein
VKMILEKQMECRLAGEPEVLVENLPSANFVHHKIPHNQKPVTNRLRYCVALTLNVNLVFLGTLLESIDFFQWYMLPTSSWSKFTFSVSFCMNIDL